MSAVKSIWQLTQAAKCPCKGSDDYCGCQNENPDDYGPLPEPRIVRISLDGVVQHFATFSRAKLDDLRLCDLRPYPALDAAVFMTEILKGGEA